MKDSVPSLPQVLVRILDAIYEQQADLPKLSAIILQDTGMSARILSVANSSLYYRGRHHTSLERAVVHLGSDVVKTLVMTAAMKQLFSRFGERDPRFLKQVWRNALVTANLSQVLATLTAYSRPEEAYLSGLMVDIGRLIRFGDDPQRDSSLIDEATDEQELIDYEREHYGSSHCEIAAEVMEEWGLSSFVADAVRYHLESAVQVQDAHHLVKIVNLAYALGRPGPVGDDAFVAADTLFGLNEGLTEELRTRVEDDVAQLASSLGIEMDTHGDGTGDSAARYSLAARVEGLNQLARLRGEFAELEQLDRRHEAVQRTLLLTFGVRRSLLFLSDDEDRFLQAWIGDNPDPDFALALERGRSVIADAVLDCSPVQLTVSDLERLSIVDRQVFGVCRANALWVQPLPRQQDFSGALVLGLTAEQLAEMEGRRGFLFALGHEITRALIAARGSAEGALAHEDSLERRLRENVHEASNPLSTLQNYLAVLRLKLGDAKGVQGEICAIRDEIERVGRILMRLREAPREVAAMPISLNYHVRQITDVFAASVCAARGIELAVDLAPNDPTLFQSSDRVRQILTNLLKNAVEALGEGGKILVSTRDAVSVGGRQYSELKVQDNGPGLPREVMETLFSPVKSRKGSGHAGLGLSIVKRLVDAMDGMILCSSNTDEGTRFLVLLPRAVTD